MKKVLLIHPMLLLTFFAFAAAPNDPVARQFGYIENKGQIIDQNNQLNPAVKYLYNGNGLNVQLRANGYSYDSYAISPSKSPQKEDLGFADGTPPLRGARMGLDSNFIYHFHRIDIEFIGANKSPEIISEQPSGDFTNYYTTGTPEEGVLNVRTYQKVIYKNLYKGIDLQFSLIPGSSPKEMGVFVPEYNFIVHPGADASLIKWKYNGAFKTSLQDGKIILSVEQGMLEEKIPSSFINGSSQTINVSYKSIEENVFSFSIPSYEKNSTLIIDPVPWATYCGGSGDEYATGIVSDAGGNILTTGYTTSTSAIATSGAYQTTYGGGSYDCYVIKFNSSGTRIWSTYCGGSGDDYGTGITTDTIGNIFITGYTTSASAIASSGAYQTSLGGGFDAYLLKFNNSGARQWGTYLGGSSSDLGYGITHDHGGNIFITGYTASTSGIASSGAYQTSLSGTYDAFIAKFNATGTLLWSTYFGVAGNEFGDGIAADTSGNIFITGWTSSATGLATTGAYQTTALGGSYDGFVEKFDSSGARIWGTYFGGSGADYPMAAADANGTLLISGYTSSTTNIASAGAYQTAYGGGTYDAFIVKFSSAGSRLWSSYCGGSGVDQSYGVISDANGNVFISGNTSSSSAIASAGAYQTTNGGGTNDGFVVKFNSSGTRLWGTYFGGSNYDDGKGVCTDAAGNIFLTGNTTSISGIVTSGAYQTTYGGGTYDAFIAAFTPNGSLPVTFVSFTAEQKNKAVNLIWQTASEINNDKFDVERSLDNSQWSVSGNVKGNGTTNSTHYYQFIDLDASHLSVTGNRQPIILYYRLKQIDIDGKFEYSKTVAVSFDKANNTQIIIAPNPASDELTITSGTQNLKSYKLIVTDMLGRNLLESIILNNGNEFNMSINELKTGAYILTIQNGDEVNRLNFVKQ